MRVSLQLLGAACGGASGWTALTFGGSNLGKPPCERIKSSTCGQTLLHHVSVSIPGFLYYHALGGVQPFPDLVFLL